MKYLSQIPKEKQMKIWVAVIAVVAMIGVTIPVLAVTTPVPPTPSQTDVENRYIVVLRSDKVKDARGEANKHSKSHGAKVSRVYSHALKGYSAKMTSAQAAAVAKDPNVASVEADGIMKADTTQTSAPWGLDRIDQSSRALNTTYTYASTGKGVKVYVIDTGVRKTHSDFSGRVVDGFDAVDNTQSTDDCNGHGTHVAGTIGGTTYGVAKDVTIVPVRVLGCDAFGYWSWIIAGIDWVTAQHQAGDPAIANMSLGGGASSAVDAAVQNSIASGVSYAIAAGNNSKDACQYSPARVSTAMTIGATDQTDTKASWSNYGRCVSWFAPGVNIVSDWNTSDTATNVDSGTSMATPHTVGVAALYLQKFPSSSPQQVKNALFQQTTKNIVSRSNSTNNRLLFTNY